VAGAGRADRHLVGDDSGRLDPPDRKGTPSTVTVRFELDDAVADVLRQPEQSVEDGAREPIVTELYRRGAISCGRAAVTLGIPLADFLRRAANLGIPYVDDTKEEWEAEKQAIREIAAEPPPSAMPTR
jgi:predicted HTH domain antitoxin